MGIAQRGQAGEIAESAEEVDYFGSLTTPYEEGQDQNITKFHLIYYYHSINHKKMQQKFEEISDDVDLKPCKMSAATDQDFSHDSDEEQTHQRRPYGNLITFRQQSPHISIGCCFLIGFFFLFFINYYVIDILLESSQNILFRIATLFLCVGHPLSYILTALSNPGVIIQSLPQAPNTNYCKKCKINIPHHARHCDECGVCIEYFDHHCPTYSKCIGGGNKIQFYSFIILTPIYMLFTVVSFLFLMSRNLAKIENMSKSL